MASIIEFLVARIAEDERQAESCRYLGWFPGKKYGMTTVSHARVLAECAAKRAILSGSHWEPHERPTDSELHFRGSHPAYQYKTTEGQRKAWDDADEPPEGDGWERNTDSGRDGWDRFEFHEESYWRRLKPESERKEWKQWIPNELRAIAAVYKDHPDYQQEWAL